MACSMASTCMVAKNPSLPVLIPIIGIPKSFTKMVDLNMVPSPPILTKKSKDLSKSLKVW